MEGRIVRSWTHLDYLDIMRQAGYWPLAPSLGQEGAWLGPMTNDGVILTAQDEAVSRRCFDLVMAMQAALGYFSGRSRRRARGWMRWCRRASGTRISCGMARAASAARAA